MEKVEFFDLTDSESFAHRDPLPYLKYLRHTAPVSRIFDRTPEAYWAVVKYNDVLEVHRDVATYSIECPMVIGHPRELAAHGHKIVIRELDPPRHTKLRNVLKWDFTPKAVASWAVPVRRWVREYLAEAARRGECEFVFDVAARVPMQQFSEMIGVAEADRPRLENLSNIVAYGQPNAHGDAADNVDAVTANQRLEEYFSRMLVERARIPAKDLTTTLAHGRIDGDPLSYDEQLRNLAFLLVAGLETTRNGIASGLYELLQHRGELEKLVADPSLVNSAVEEILRYASPIYHDLRMATRDTMLGGQKIARGDLVSKWLASANRDEEVFENPDTFDITRNPNPHLAFGYGQHFCLGANLARVEMRTTLEELIPYLRQIELTDTPQRTNNSAIQGYWRMPIRFRNVNRSIHV